MTSPTTIACAAKTARSKSSTSATWTWTRPDASRTARPRFGLTLLELLIVIALLIAIAAAVLPPMVSSLHERAFDSAMDVAARQLLLARNHAQMTGQAIEVVYADDPPRIAARVFKIDNEADDAAALPHAWAERLLGQGWTLSDAHPSDEQSADANPALPEAPAQPMRLALFLPDGSAIVSNRRWLSDGDARFAELLVNPYTGSTQFTRLLPDEVQQGQIDEQEDLLRWEAP